MECAPRCSAHLQRKEYFNFRVAGKSADFPATHFHGRGGNEPSQSRLTACQLPRRGELLAMTEKFLVAFDTLVTGLTACALSVTFGDSSPKGRAKSTAGSFLVPPNTLATNVMAWLSLRGKTSPAPGEDVTAGDKKGNLARERLRGRIFSTEKGCPPNGRQPFPEENKENTRPKGQSEYQNILSSL